MSATISAPLHPLNAAAREATTPALSPHERAQEADDKKRDVAAKFEAIFVRKMLEQSSKSSLTKQDGLGGEFYQSMYHGQIADMASESGRGFGIANALLESWGVPPAAQADQTAHDLTLSRINAAPLA